MCPWIFIRLRCRLDDQRLVFGEEKSLENISRERNDKVQCVPILAKRKMTKYSLSPNISRKENDKNSVSQFQQKEKRQGTVCPNTSRKENDKVQYMSQY